MAQTPPLRQAQLSRPKRRQPRAPLRSGPTRTAAQPRPPRALAPLIDRATLSAPSPSSASPASGHNLRSVIPGEASLWARLPKITGPLYKRRPAPPCVSSRPAPPPSNPSANPATPAPEQSPHHRGLAAPPPSSLRRAAQKLRLVPWDLPEPAAFDSSPPLAGNSSTIRRR